MPIRIQDTVLSRRVAQATRIVGMLPLMVDEVVVPVLTIRDLAHPFRSVEGNPAVTTVSQTQTTAERTEVIVQAPPVQFAGRRVRISITGWHLWSNTNTRVRIKRVARSVIQGLGFSGSNASSAWRDGTAGAPLGVAAARTTGTPIDIDALGGQDWSVSVGPNVHATPIPTWVLESDNERPVLLFQGVTDNQALLVSVAYRQVDL